ncbi:hypothetical protein HGRIS_013798 [Hohenbuehelia grisea]|uniref:Nephrocystin 3-like N-terminal domain-containing protein n=1 Tax=Hohenbuehelia grisea TaxID=104357 RepID=A0ABR3IWU9_9AGAR
MTVDVELDISCCIVLHLKHAPHARFDSYQPFRDEMLGQLVPCMEGTRTRVLAEIRDWMQSTLGSEQVFWVKGHLGTGKTTIAHTVAKQAKEIGLLGANFFFSRFDESLHDPRLLFPTIAYHLALFHPAFKQAIVSAVAAEPDIAHLQPASQLDLLLRSVPDTLEDIRHPITFVFDALDEFERGIGSFRGIMHLFIHGLAKLSPKIRILVTSRPEPYIDSVMRSVTTRGLPVRVYNLDEDPETEEDIRAYLRAGFAQISASWDLVPQDKDRWYTEGGFSALASEAGKSFAYASTALRFIADPAACNPRGQLDIILEGYPVTAPSRPNPHTALDNLYMLVLQRAYPKSQDESTLDMLRSVIAYTAVVTNLTRFSDDVIQHFMSCTRQDVTHYLRNLGAIFFKSDNGSLQPHHRGSFRDLLTNRKRCCDARFFVDRNKYQLQFAIKCFETVQRCCSQHGSDPAIVASTVPDAITLQYGACSRDSECCKYALHEWTFQTLRSDPDDSRWTTQVALLPFLRSEGFISWVAKRLVTVDHSELAPIHVSSIIMWNCQLKPIVRATLRRDADVWKIFITREQSRAWANQLGFTKDGTDLASVEEINSDVDSANEHSKSVSLGCRFQRAQDTDLF